MSERVSKSYTQLTPFQFNVTDFVHCIQRQAGDISHRLFCPHLQSLTSQLDHRVCVSVSTSCQSLSVFSSVALYIHYTILSHLCTVDQSLHNWWIDMVEGKRGPVMAVTLILINGGSKVGAKYHHNKQTQQVTTIVCGFANRVLDNHSDPPWNGNDLKEANIYDNGQGREEMSRNYFYLGSK